MGCNGCSVDQNGRPKGCKSNGSCLNGGCNKLNTFDWLSRMDLQDPEAFDIVEISFKNGARKSFYKNTGFAKAITGDMVVVESNTGYDVGEVCLSGELVRLQMKKKKTSEEKVIHTIIRKANERDIEKLRDARSLERKTMVRARVIARTLDLEMKIGDVEYQGDRRKATFYYTAEGRVDFRELIRHYAKEFKVKIEMRQIGTRQESARIGGIGSCGRELCCSTWLTDFKSVSTTAARYQNLAINQAKLSGQCGRLKCCLNYELDTYLEALEAFPEGAEILHTNIGKASLVKTDIFKKLMYYTYQNESGRGKMYILDLEKVKLILEMNANGEKPQSLEGMNVKIEVAEEDEIDFEDVTGVIELPISKKSKRSRRNRRRGRSGGNKKPSDQDGRNRKGGNKNTGKQGDSNNNSNNSKGGSNKGNNKGGENKSGSNRNRRKKRNNSNKNRKPPNSGSDKN